MVFVIPTRGIMYHVTRFVHFLRAFHVFGHFRRRAHV